MALVYVQRYVVENAFEEGGTQYVDGVLSFTAPTVITLSNAVFGATGDYVLFDLSGSPAADPFPGGQSALNTYVIPYIDASGLILSGLNPAGGTTVLEYDATNKRIILKLVSNPTNGCQYVDQTLSIAAPITVYLSADLYKTAGTYTLFDWSGGGSFTGSVSNINLVHLGGRAVVSGPTVVGNTIQFTLA